MPHFRLLELFGDVAFRKSGHRGVVFAIAPKVFRMIRSLTAAKAPTSVSVSSKGCCPAGIVRSCPSFRQAVVAHPKALLAARTLCCRSGNGNGGPIFSDAFQQALQEALDRQGEEALYSGSAYDEDRVTASEELLLTSVHNCKLNIAKLTTIQKEVEASLERETKQLERLEFVLEKVKADAAFYKVLDAMNQ